MSIKKYVSDESLEKLAEVAVVEIVMPALDKLVADSSNPYDDAALAIAKPMIMAAIDKIDGEVG